jgi:hypothetical protein
MCFSANASFTAAAVIGSISVFTVKSSWNNSYRYFGLIPVLFALQQMAEGFIWKALNQEPIGNNLPLLTTIFLFFAWCIWPVLIPLSMYKIETTSWKKKSFIMLSAMGIITAIISIFHLFNNEPIAYVSNFHIDYKLGIPVKMKVLIYTQEVIYVICTLIPLFMSSSKKMYLFASANLISLLLAFVFFENALPSTWCFFAAVLSGLIYFMIQINLASSTHFNLANKSIQKPKPY